MPDPLDTTESTPAGTIAAPDRVITREQGALVCLHCRRELPPPAPRAQRPARFCRGSKCRSAWHADQRKALIARIHAELADIRGRLDGVARLVQELR